MSDMISEIEEIDMDEDADSDVDSEEISPAMMRPQSLEVIDEEPEEPKEAVEEPLLGSALPPPLPELNNPVTDEEVKLDEPRIVDQAPSDEENKDDHNGGEDKVGSKEETNQLEVTGPTQDTPSKEKPLEEEEE